MNHAVKILATQDNYVAEYACKRCTECILSENFPNIEIDELGICSVCKEENAKSESTDIQEKSWQDVKALIEATPNKSMIV